MNIIQMKYPVLLFYFFGLLLVSCDKRPAQESPAPGATDKYDNYIDWAIYRGDKKSNQYSELAQINAANVHKLRPIWEYHTGDPNGPSMYSNPIIIEGLMYFTTPRLDAIALNAVTGEQVWKFESSQYNEDKKIFRGPYLSSRKPNLLRKSSVSTIICSSNSLEYCFTYFSSMSPR